MRLLKAALTLAISIAASAAFVESAHAATGISITGPTATTATATNLTLTGSAVGTVIRNVTLNISSVRTGTSNCSGTQLILLAIIPSGSVQVITPSTVTEQELFGTVWTLNAHCTNGTIDVDASGNPILSRLGIGFQMRINAITQPLYAGSVTETLNAGGSGLTLNASALTATPGGSTGALRGSYSLSPAISYRLI